jgi:indolepyruvate ferredoxin oxidoreductase beta subunit
MLKEKNKNFNLVIVGYGGQGVLSLAEIVASAAFYQGYKVKGTELHGLAQRGGGLESHLRFGSKIFSPLVRRADADLIIGLELLETLHACYYAYHKKTVILTNTEFLNPQPFSLDNNDSSKIIQQIKKFTKVFKAVPATEIIKKETRETAMINVFMLGKAMAEGFLPIKKKFILRALKEKIRPIFWQENERIFEMAYKK